MLSGFFLLSFYFFPHLISAVTDWKSTILLHMVWPSANLGLKCAARWKCRTQKIAKNSPSGHHRTTLSGYIFATKAQSNRQSEKKLLNSIISSTCPHNMVNFGPLLAEICWRVWGTPANFTGFASCLRYCSDVAHRRPTNLCTMSGRLLGWYTIYTFSGALAP